jgi:DNA repair exonuclease SbcCD ATPase subunit
MNQNQMYEQKYLKYKQKYLQLKAELEGGISLPNPFAKKVPQSNAPFSSEYKNLEKKINGQKKSIEGITHELKKVQEQIADHTEADKITSLKREQDAKDDEIKRKADEEAARRKKITDDAVNAQANLKAKEAERKQKEQDARNERKNERRNSTSSSKSSIGGVWNPFNKKVVDSEETKQLKIKETTLKAKLDQFNKELKTIESQLTDQRLTDIKKYDTANKIAEDLKNKRAKDLKNSQAATRMAEERQKNLENQLQQNKISLENNKIAEEASRCRIKENKKTPECQKFFKEHPGNSPPPSPPSSPKSFY